MTLYTQLSIHFGKKNWIILVRIQAMLGAQGYFQQWGLADPKRGGGLQTHSPLNLNNIEKSNVTRRKQKKNKETII